MRHRASARFWQLHDELPPQVKEAANKSFALLKAEPRHPSLRLKRAGRYWSVLVDLDYRALGLDDPEGISWFWIGSHAEYDRLLRG